tara:strand:+ start:482 stop:712 length:231 start_codon:yes stop_codon:yes gene_type:complete
MYLIIETLGTEEHLKIAEDIQDYAEDNFGCTCETVVGNEDSISLYDEGLNKFATFTEAPKDVDLNWYLALSLDVEE